MPVIKGATFGILLMLAAQVIMPANDAIAKFLVVAMPAMQIAWARFFFNAAFLLPFVFWRHGMGALRTTRPALQIVRGLVIVIANICFLIGVRYVPLADALALVFVTPLVVAALSPPLLGERVSAWEWVAIVLGFVGALIIVRPGFNELELAAMLPLLAGILFAVYLMLTRMLAQTARPVITLSMTSLVGAIVMSALLPFFWQTPTVFQFVMMVIVGAGSLLGHLCITAAHSHAEASTLAPLTYLAIVTATILGYLVFGDIPGWLTWVGAAIVIASGLFIWWLRRPRARHAREAAAA